MQHNPYATPPIVSPLPADAPAEKQYYYRPLKQIARWIAISVALMLLLTIAAAAVETAGAMLNPEFTNPNAPVENSTELSLILVQVGLGALTLPLYLSACIGVCVFMYRANANLRAVGAKGLKTTPGWAAGWWFVPIANLFKPYQAMKEIYQCSHAPASTEWRRVRTPGTLAVWWAVWLSSLFLSNLESRLALRGVDLGDASLLLNWSSAFATLFAGLGLLSLTGTIARVQSGYPRWQAEQAQMLAGHQPESGAANLAQ